jgi:hypothetical protein
LFQVLQELPLVHLVLQQLEAVLVVEDLLILVLEEMVVQVVVVAELVLVHTEEEQEIHLQLLPLKEKMGAIVPETVMVAVVV